MPYCCFGASRDLVAVPAPACEGLESSDYYINVIFFWIFRFFTVLVAGDRSSSRIFKCCEKKS